MVKVNLHCGFDQIWQGEGCEMIGVTGEKETAIKEQLQHNAQLKLKGMHSLVTYSNCVLNLFQFMNLALMNLTLFLNNRI